MDEVTIANKQFRSHVRSCSILLALNRPTLATHNQKMSAARYRKPGAVPPNPTGEKEKAELKQAVKEQAAATSNRLSVLDVLRILGGIVLLSSGLSYLTTGGESMTWRYNPWWTRVSEWRGLLVRQTVFLPKLPLSRKRRGSPRASTL